MNNEYSNTIIKDIQVRHESSMNIMEHFFLNDLNTKERWEFIENYFLGYNMISEEEDSGN